MWWGNQAEITNLAETWEKYSHQDHRWEGHPLSSLKSRALYREHLPHRSKRSRRARQTWAITHSIPDMLLGVRNPKTNHTPQPKGEMVRPALRHREGVEDTGLLDYSCVYWAVGGGVKDRSIWNDCHVSLFLGFLTGHLRLDNSLGRSIPSTAGYVTFLDLCCISSHWWWPLHTHT